ncbi:MAG: RES family NAD+ phosphorylase [Roseiarcus sp.]
MTAGVAAVLPKLEAFPVEKFVGDVFRVTSLGADPLAPSVNGGRWAPPTRSGPPVPVLYTSFEREGALAEVCSYLILLNPVPTARPLKVSRLGVSTGRSLRLARADLEALGVEMSRYGERDYARTQEVGAAAASLGIEGLIAPSARWPCDNLMIFTNNQHAGERLEVVGSEEVEWRAWARSHGFLGA